MWFDFEVFFILFYKRQLSHQWIEEKWGAYEQKKNNNHEMELQSRLTKLESYLLIFVCYQKTLSIEIPTILLYHSSLVCNHLVESSAWYQLVPVLSAGI